MTDVPLSEAKDKLSSLVDDAMLTHEIVHITKHGRRAVVLMAEDDLESLHETIFWLSQPGARSSIDRSAGDLQSGVSASGPELRKQFGLDG